MPLLASRHLRGRLPYLSYRPAMSHTRLRHVSRQHPVYNSIISCRYGLRGQTRRDLPRLVLGRLCRHYLLPSVPFQPRVFPPPTFSTNFPSVCSATSTSHHRNLCSCQSPQPLLFPSTSINSTAATDHSSTPPSCTLISSPSYSSLQLNNNIILIRPSPDVEHTCLLISVLAVYHYKPLFVAGTRTLTISN